MRVLYNSKPLAGNKGVENGDSVTKIPEDQIPRSPTATDGKAMVPIKKWGWQILAIDVDQPSATPQLADTDHFSATLSFYLSHR